MPVAANTRTSCTVLGLLLAIGCAQRAQVIRAPIPTVQEIVARVRENGAGLRDFEGRAAISIHSGGIKHDMKAAVLFKRPDVLKMELTGFMGMSLATMALQDGHFQLYMPMLNRVLEGRSDSERLQRLTGIPFDLCDLKDVLFGANLLAGLGSSEVWTAGVSRNQYVLSARTADRTWRVWVDAARLLVVKQEVMGPEGDLLMRRTYSNYLEDDGVLIPRSIHISRGDQEVHIRFTASNINSGLSASRFEMAVPADAVRVAL